MWPLACGTTCGVILFLTCALPGYHFNAQVQRKQIWQTLSCFRHITRLKGHPGIEQMRNMISVYVSAGNFGTNLVHHCLHPVLYSLLMCDMRVSEGIWLWKTQSGGVMKILLVIQRRSISIFMVIIKANTNFIKRHLVKGKIQAISYWNYWHTRSWKVKKHY